MKRSFLGFLVIAVMLPAIATIATADDAKEAAIKKDQVEFNGFWQVVECVIDGKKLPDARRLIVFSHDDGTWSLFDNDKEKTLSKGIYTIDPTKKPKAIDFTKTEGDGKGHQYVGIYEIGKTTRKLCFVPANKQRPSDFTSPSGNGRFLIILKQAPSDVGVIILPSRSLRRQRTRRDGT